jgi:hypothetical protein
MGRSVVTLVLLIAAVSACQGTFPTPSPSPSPSPTATPSATPSPTPTETASPTPTPTPTLDPLATPTPLPTDAPGAYAAVRSYEDALLAGQYEAAWGMLGKGSQGTWGSLESFEKERSAFLATAGTAYKEQIHPDNTLPLSQWIEGTTWGPGINQAKAYLISVTWTALADNKAAVEIWVANPVPGGWKLYKAH